MTDTATASAKLLVKLQGQDSRTIDIARDTFTIGRKADNDLSIDDHTVSGRHAKITKVQAVYFLEDLKSTNGTRLNGKPIDRAQLRDTDVVTIGQHRIIFQDSAPAPAAVLSGSIDMEQTMAIRGHDMHAGQPTTMAKVFVTAGKTERLECHLTKPTSLIGSQEGATVRLTGWFAPKSAALISNRGGVYSISPSRGNKKLLVNGNDISSQQQLRNGDLIEVAGVSMTFYLIPQKKKS